MIDSQSEGAAVLAAYVLCVLPQAFAMPLGWRRVTFCCITIELVLALLIFLGAGGLWPSGKQIARWAAATGAVLTAWPVASLLRRERA